METLDALGAIGHHEALARIAWAQALDARGDPRSQHALASARDRLLARAARIDDPSLRASFLHQVPECALTLALAAARGLPTPDAR